MLWVFGEVVDGGGEVVVVRGLVVNCQRLGVCGANFWLKIGWGWDFMPLAWVRVVLGGENNVLICKGFLRIDRNL